MAYLLHFLLINICAMAVTIHLHLQDILGRKKCVDMLCSQRHFAFTYPVQQ